MVNCIAAHDIKTMIFSFSVMNVSTAIPVIMGANIGTSVTGVLVAVTQAGHRDNFE
jgi:sodium-dependent phosphate cotransporter